MSVEAITWALSQRIKPSSTKFVLVALANCADGKDFVAWPSVKYLEDATGQDRKTVIANLQRLTDRGLISDSGERRGETRQIVVYRLMNGTESGTVSKSPKSGTLNKSPKNGTVYKHPENGTIPNSTESGTVPFLDGNSTEIPGKEYRNSRETVPKTGHGTVIEPSIEPSRKKEEGAEAPMPKVETAKDLAQWLVNLQLPPGIEPDMWAEWVAYRRKQKNLTIRACKEALAELQRLQAQGHDPNDVMRYSMFRGWTGLFPRRDQAGPAGGLNRQETLEQANRRVAEQAKAARDRRKREGTLEYGLMTDAERADQAFQSAEGDQPFPEYP